MMNFASSSRYHATVTCDRFPRRNPVRLQGHVKNGVVVSDGDFPWPEDSLVLLIPFPERREHPSSTRRATVTAACSALSV